LRLFQLTLSHIGGALASITAAFIALGFITVALTVVAFTVVQPYAVEWR
jgi:hypothetical protein